MSNNLLGPVARSLLLLKRVNTKSFDKIVPKSDLEAFFGGGTIDAGVRTMICRMAGLQNTDKPRLDSSIVHIFHINSKDSAFEMAILNELFDSIKCVRLKTFGQMTRMYALQCGRFKCVVIDHLGLSGFSFSIRRIGTHAFWLKGSENNSIISVDNRALQRIVDGSLTPDDFDRIFIDYGISWADVEKAMRDNGVTKKEIVALIQRAGQLRANRSRLALAGGTAARFIYIPPQGKDKIAA